MMSSRIWSSSSSACCCNVKWAACKFCIILQKPVLKQDKWLALILLQTRAFAVNKQVILVTHKDHVPGLYIPLRHCARWGNQQLPRHPAVLSQNSKRQVKGILAQVKLTMQERYSRSAVAYSTKRVPECDLRSNGGEKQSVRTKCHTCISAMSEERLRLTDVRIPFTNSNKCRAAWTKVRSSKGILQEFRSNRSPNPRIAQIIRCDDNDESGLSPKRLRSTLKSGTQP
jgi:hypothetical protein